MDQEYINKITLEYLLNPNILIGNKIQANDLDIDIKFYRKRICLLTKEMSKGIYINNNLKNAFQNYASEITYFLKQQDIKDFCQQEYIDLSFNKEINTQDNDYLDNLADNIDNIIDHNRFHIDNSVNDLLINKPSPPINLNNFVKKINIETTAQIIPIKKNINMKDPSLRIKGIKKE